MKGMDFSRKLPIGIQDFEKLRTDSYLYVDKTAYIHRIVNEGCPYFLGRPRRFGKSLFLSTLKAYFQGKKELFEGLAIAELEKDWVEYPVFHLDLNLGSYAQFSDLEHVLNVQLTRLESQWGKEDSEGTFSTRLAGLMRRAYEKTKKRVVVLVDEYDKPLTSTLDKPELHEKIREALSGFYGVLKTADSYLRFLMLTGITKFSKVSIFSQLNQLQDISMNEYYAGVCGISETELLTNFEPEIRKLAERRKLSYEEALAELKKRYDGYHFAKESEGVYNPFSVLNTFATNDFDYYWFSTGTPTFLAKMLKDADFDIPSLENDVMVEAPTITDYHVGDENPLPLLYQTGYLTIKAFEKQFNEYRLGFPNEEVKYGFLRELQRQYSPQALFKSEFSISKFVRELEAADVDGFMTRIRAFFADIAYDLNNKTEKDFQKTFYLLFKVMGHFVQTEVKSAVGRSDIVVWLKDTIYVFEFKLAENATAEEALAQIDDKGYLIPYSADERKIVKIGAEFSRAERTLSRWVRKDVG
ncbi:ATPase AAA [Bacteroidia bacterium]|nr:ATPase AAA [Bacteroidia bacterium]